MIRMVLINSFFWMEILCAFSAPRFLWAQEQPEAPILETLEDEEDLPRLPDPTYVLDGIELEGEFKTRPSIIYEALALSQGDLINVSALKAAKIRLLSTGYFSQVQLALKAGQRKGHVILIVRLRERLSFLLSDLPLGVSKRTPFWGGFDIVDNNFLGSGHTLRWALVGSSDQWGTEWGWTLPNVGKSALSMGLRMHWIDGREWAFVYDNPQGLPQNVDYQKGGGILSLGYHPHPLLGFYWDFKADVLWSDSEVDLQSALPNGKHFVQSQAMTVEWDSRDDPVMPHKGIRLHFSMERSSPTLGSSFHYTKIQTLVHGAYSFSSRHILRVSAWWGKIWGDPPFFDRFFIGDFDDLIPSRTLGLNFNDRPIPDFLNTGADQLAYETQMLRFALEYAIPLGNPIDFMDRIEFFMGLGCVGGQTPSSQRLPVRLGLRPRAGEATAFPMDLTFDLGLRVETEIGIFGLSFGNGLALIPL